MTEKSKKPITIKKLEQIADLYLVAYQNEKDRSLILGQFLDENYPDYYSMYRDQIQGILEEKRQANEVKTTLDLSIFRRKMVLPRRFGYDFHEGHAFCGTFIADHNGEPEPILIFDDRRYIREVFFKEHMLKFQNYPPFATNKYGWSNQSIEHFLSNGLSIEPNIVFEKVLAYLKRWLYFPNPTTYEVIACYIMALHVWIAFGAFPRVFITAKPDSGKSQLVKAIRNLAFSPMIGGDTSKPSLYRTASDTAGLICIDNFDQLDDEQKKAVIHFLEISYQKDMSVIRVDEIKGKKVPVAFQVGTPALAASLDLSLFTHAALTRAIIFVMERCEQAMDELPDDMPSSDSNEVRDLLYSWGVSNVAKVKDEATLYNVDFVARQRQISKPLLYIAHLVGGGLEKRIENWLKANYETYHSEDEYSDRAQIVKVLYDMCHQSREPKVRISVKDATELLLMAQGISKTDDRGHMNMRYGSILNAKAQKASVLLAAIPTAQKKILKGRTFYEYERRALFRYFARYGLLDDIESQTLLSDTPSPPSLPSLPSPPSPPSPHPTLTPTSDVRGEGVEGGEGKEGIQGKYTLRLLADIPEFVMGDGRIFKDSKSGQIVQVPGLDALFLIEKGLADMVDDVENGGVD